MECKTEDIHKTDPTEAESSGQIQHLTNQQGKEGDCSETPVTCLSNSIESEHDTEPSLEIVKEDTLKPEADRAEDTQDKMRLAPVTSEHNIDSVNNSSVVTNGDAENDANSTESTHPSQHAVVSDIKTQSSKCDQSKHFNDSSGLKSSVDNSDELLSELESELRSADELHEEVLAGDKKDTECCENTLSTSDNDVNKGKQRTVGEETVLDTSVNILDEAVTGTANENVNSCTLPIINQSIAKVQSDTSVLTSRVQVQSVTDSSGSQGDKSGSLPNGVIPVSLTDIPEFEELQGRYNTLQKLYIEKEVDIKRLQEDLQKAAEERAVHVQKIDTLSQQLEHQQCEEKVNQLEEKLSTQSLELEEVKSKLVSQDAAARKHIQQLQTDLQGRLTQVTRVYEECKKEKEGMVVKYAMSEQKNIELMEKMMRNEKWMKDIEREREQAIVKFKQMKSDKEKSEGAVLARGQEIVNMRREIEKQKELRGEVESKCKWANARLKQELEAHKELKSKHEDLSKKHQQLQETLKEKRQSEEVQKMTLAVQLDEKENALRQQQQEKTDQEEVHQMVRGELESLKRKHKETLEELRTYKDKVTCLEAERLHQEETLTRFKDTLQTQKKDHAELCQRIGELEQAGQQLAKARDQIEKLKTHLSDLEESNHDLRAEMENCTKREGGHLDFTKKVSDKNARLQSENSSLSNKLSTLQSEHEELQGKCVNLEQKIANLEENLSKENQQRIQENGMLRSKLEEKSRAVEELSQLLEDQKDENKTLKRRHQANIKDLSRQLQAAKRKLEAGGNHKTVNGERDSQSLGSMGSRTSSGNSLNTVGEGVGSVQDSPTAIPQEEEQPIVQFVEVDKQVLVDKIVKLQRQAARKNEKLEFMEDHINQLIEELQRKAKIVQSYALREESGTLAPEEMDLNKAQLSKKGGIMASVYSKHLQDDHMTMDLSLEINRKLQAVLEDTLLKNITLKENMDTLGSEIANLSHSNRDLQLEIQQLREQLNSKS